MNDERTSDDAKVVPIRDRLPVDMIGLCPQCVAIGDYGAEYTYLRGELWDILCCEKHRCYWCFDWHYPADPSKEPEQEWSITPAEFSAMTEVKPRHLPETERRWAARDRKKLLIAELGGCLSSEQQEVVISQLCALTGMVVEHDRLRHRFGDGAF